MPNTAYNAMAFMSARTDISVTNEIMEIGIQPIPDSIKCGEFHALSPVPTQL
jgi:hypothetical protein